MVCKVMGLHGLGWAGADGEEVGTGEKSEGGFGFLQTAQDGPDSQRLCSRHNAAISQAWMSRGVCVKERGWLCV